MAATPTVEDLIEVLKELEPAICLVNSKPEPLDETDGGRLKLRIELATRWENELLPAFEAARRNSQNEHERRAIGDLRTALAAAIISGGEATTNKVFEARRDLESCPPSEPEANDYIGPFAPSEWRRRFGKMTETTWRREVKKMRVDVITLKSLRIHRDDVARYEKREPKTAT
jgi:hypothetical protein